MPRISPGSSPRPHLHLVGGTSKITDDPNDFDSCFNNKKDCVASMKRKCTMNDGSVRYFSRRQPTLYSLLYSMIRYIGSRLSQTRMIRIVKIHSPVSVLVISWDFWLPCPTELFPLLLSIIMNRTCGTSESEPKRYSLSHGLGSSNGHGHGHHYT